MRYPSWLVYWESAFYLSEVNEDEWDRGSKYEWVQIREYVKDVKENVLLSRQPNSQFPRDPPQSLLEIRYQIVTRRQFIPSLSIIDLNQL